MSSLQCLVVVCPTTLKERSYSSTKQSVPNWSNHPKSVFDFLVNEIGDLEIFY